MGCGVDWLAFFAAMAVIELTPGPNMGWLTALSAQQGRRVGFMAVSGITLGLAVQLAAAATGFSAFVAGHDAVYQGLRWAGVIFMLYLAWEAFAQGGDTSPGKADGLDGFRHGFIANLLNPKALVFYIAVVGQFALCGDGSGPATGLVLALGALHIAVSAIVHITLVLVGAGLGARIAGWRSLLSVRLGFALMLVAIAVWIALST